MMQSAPKSGMSLENLSGMRKYTTAQENAAFCRSAAEQDNESELFALSLYHTGCRISEALNLTREDLNLDKSTIRIFTLKQRGKIKIREVPVQRHFIVHLATLAESGKLWHFSRTTGWRRIKKIMREAGISDGPHACPKGLRHGFGISCVEQGVALPRIQSWMGHENINTTMIYTKAVGLEDRVSAEDLWKRDVPVQYRDAYDEFRKDFEIQHADQNDRDDIDQIIVDLSTMNDAQADICEKYENSLNTGPISGKNTVKLSMPSKGELKEENIRLRHLVAEQLLTIQSLEQALAI